MLLLTSLARRVLPAAADNVSAAAQADARGLPTTSRPLAAAADEPSDPNPAMVLPRMRAYRSSFLKFPYPCSIVNTVGAIARFSIKSFLLCNGWHWWFCVMDGIGG